MLTHLLSPFFDAQNWHQAVMTTDGWTIIISIVILESLLSVDNAVVLAAKTSTLDDPKAQAHALFAGLWSAFILRLLVIVFATYFIKIWQIKVLGALYLVYLSIDYFYRRKHPKQAGKKAQRHQTPHSFLLIVLELEMINFFFSIDSVLASVAISPNPVIVLIGGIVGILAVRFIANAIMKLIHIIPEIEPMAYILIVLIAIKLFMEIPAINIKISSSLFALMMGVVALITYLFHRYRHL
ncbi:TerC family protein [Weissella soli]|uniref:TerC family protein n=1 Tax=Weissella soli TaxID=155866 RepID=UPI001F2005D5|nr:DUF475 domain-containing protein [Weissella soli]GJM47699.1 membrane protein [Weissella soli]